MPIEQPQFESTPNSNNPESNPNELKGGVNIEQKQEREIPAQHEHEGERITEKNGGKISQEKQPETEPGPEEMKEGEKTNEDLTPEEVKEIFEAAEKAAEKEIFETTEKEIKLRSTLEKWMKGLDTELRQRAEHFGLKESTIEEITESLEKSFNEDLRTVRDPEWIEKTKEKSSKTIANLIEQEDKPILKNLLDRLSKKDIFDLLNRKLHGEVTLEEKKILDLFSYTAKRGRLGSCDPLSGEIEVSLLNSRNLKEYNATSAHEFTHKALSSFMPEKVKEKMSHYRTEALIKIFKKNLKEMGYGEQIEEVEEKKTPAEEIQNKFFTSLRVIDESLAHCAGRYYGAEDEPYYLSYKRKIHPEDFKRIYSLIASAASGKSLKEFDHFAAHIYSFFANKWSENLSQKDLKEAAVSTIKEINKFKEK